MKFNRNDYMKKYMAKIRKERIYPENHIKTIIKKYMALSPKHKSQCLQSLLIIDKVTK